MPTAQWVNINAMTQVQVTMLHSQYGCEATGSTNNAQQSSQQRDDATTSASNNQSGCIPLMLSAYMMPQLVLEGESLPTLWTPVGLDVVVHVHVVLKVLLSGDAFPTDATHVKVPVQMHAVPVSIHGALKSEGSITEIAHKQRLGLTAIFLSR